MTSDERRPPIDSTSVGDAGRHVALEELERALVALAPAPADGGRVCLIVVRREGGRREMPDHVSLTVGVGVPGDAWARRSGRNFAMQISVIQRDVAELIANGQPLELFGDNLCLELDLSVANLPAGSRVRIGGSLLEVTSMPHNGCRKFRARFGDDALQLVWKPELRERNLRGIYMRVVDGGDVRVGDRVEVLARGEATR